MSENALIHKIMQKAEAEKAQIAAEGDERIRLLVSSIQERTEKSCEAMLSSAQAEAAEILRTGALTDELNRRKQILHTKKEIIGSVFDGALKQLTSLEPDAWQKLIRSLIVKNAPSGSISLLAPAQDKEKYSAPFLKELQTLLSEKHGVPCRIDLCAQDADFSAGVMIQCEAYDIDLSFEQILSDIRETAENELSGILFCS